MSRPDQDTDCSLSNVHRDTDTLKCGRLETGIFDNDDATLSVPVFFAQILLFQNPKWQTHASPTICCLPCLGLHILQALLTVCFELNLSLLAIHADYPRRQRDIIRQIVHYLFQSKLKPLKRLVRRPTKAAS